MRLLDNDIGDGRSGHDDRLHIDERQRASLPAPETVAQREGTRSSAPRRPVDRQRRRTKRGNGVEQTLSLFTSSSVPGQNFLKVQFLGGTRLQSGHRQAFPTG